MHNQINTIDNFDLVSKDDLIDKGDQANKGHQVTFIDRIGINHLANKGCQFDKGF